MVEKIYVTYNQVRHLSLQYTPRYFAWCHLSPNIRLRQLCRYTSCASSPLSVSLMTSNRISWLLSAEVVTFLHVFWGQPCLSQSVYVTETNGRIDPFWRDPILPISPFKPSVSPFTNHLALKMALSRSLAQKSLERNGSTCRVWRWQT